MVTFYNALPAAVPAHFAEVRLRNFLSTDVADRTAQISHQLSVVELPPGDSRVM
jgi:hypothetical protein